MSGTTMVIGRIEFGHPLASGAALFSSSAARPDISIDEAKGREMTTYAEKLKHPKWQKLRLEILQRDDFACRQCGEREITLHVHHAYYRANADPWDYPAHSLKTLCADCHETETKALPELVADAVSMLKEAGADSYAFGCIAASFERVTARPIATDEWDVIADILKAFLASRDACGELWQEWLSRREATRFSLGDEDAAS